MGENTQISWVFIRILHFYICNIKMLPCWCQSSIAAWRPDKSHNDSLPGKLYDRARSRLYVAASSFDNRVDLNAI